MKEKNKKFYFDTYAIIEIGKKNPSYEQYKNSVEMLINKLNLLELSVFLLRESKESEINDKFKELSRFNVDYDDEILIKAAKMKHKFSNKRPSFIDCIGYQLAKKHNAKFLTGDDFFKDKENVEFVK